MITLTGIYADECNGVLADKTMQYVCRVFRHGDNFYNGIGEQIKVTDGNVLLMCGQGTWFALYQTISKGVER